MIITREIDYAIRVLRRLQNGEFLSHPKLCSNENLPIPFAYRIRKKLNKAGMVDILRGCSGGAKLTCDLGSITMYDLVEALGDHRYVSECLRPGYECEYKQSHGGKCSVQNSLAEMQDHIDNIFKSQTILEILSDSK
jgi:Rrf2 family protein